MEQTENKLFRNDCKVLVDTLFDNGLFRPDLTRNDFNSIEDLLTLTMQHKYETHLRVAKLTDRFKKQQ
jgi:hypothetical protein